MTKILVVEDEASFSEALSYVLGKEGFEVTVDALVVAQDGIYENQVTANSAVAAPVVNEIKP